MWFARSAEFLQQPVLQTLRWMRIVGDVVFLSGVAALAWFFLGLLTGHSHAQESRGLEELSSSVDWQGATASLGTNAAAEPKPERVSL
jgi:hypothetical protein